MHAWRRTCRLSLLTMRTAYPAPPASTPGFVAKENFVAPHDDDPDEEVLAAYRRAKQEVAEKKRAE